MASSFIVKCSLQGVNIISFLSKRKIFFLKSMSQFSTTKNSPSFSIEIYSTLQLPQILLQDVAGWPEQHNIPRLMACIQFLSYIRAFKFGPNFGHFSIFANFRDKAILCPHAYSSKIPTTLACAIRDGVISELVSWPFQNSGQGLIISL